MRTNEITRRSTYQLKVFLRIWDQPEHIGVIAMGNVGFAIVQLEKKGWIRRLAKSQGKQLWQCDYENFSFSDIELMRNILKKLEHTKYFVAPEEKPKSKSPWGFITSIVRGHRNENNN